MYGQKLEEWKINTSETWTIINTTIGRKRSETKIYSNEFIIDICRVTLDNGEITNHFNSFIVNLGTKLSNNIELWNTTDCLSIKKKQVSELVYMYPVTVKEVIEIVSGAKVRLSSHTTNST